MIAVKTPTRIDLAGGTLDIWPLSVIFAPSASLNVAIDLYATVEAAKTETNDIVISAFNGDATIKYSKNAPEKKKTLFHRGLDFLPIEGGWRFTVNTSSPTGAGLGGSSSLLVAFLRTLNQIGNFGLSGRAILEAAKNIEARHLGIPTGVQDYVAALNGGVNAVVNEREGQRFLPIKVGHAEIERRVALAYSGQSRVSGVPNWLMLKNAVEKDRQTVKAFERIAANSLDAMAAISEGDFGRVGKLIDRESASRELLGRGVITPRLRKAFSVAKKNGGHPKVCGAGGGGCFIAWCEPEKKEKISAALEEVGMVMLGFKVAPDNPERV